MLFSSVVFLWYFLPFVAILYHLLDNKYRNAFLLVASLFFYAWGEPRFVMLMLISISINYFFGLFIDKCNNGLIKKIAISSCIFTNIAILGYFKYFNFFIENINSIAGESLISQRNIILPIGISFYTFQALSYVIDLYRKQIDVQKNIFNLALYITFFPQLIAGPIIKYHDVDQQIVKRQVTINKTAYGIKRFIYGLSKKVILANTFGLVVDRILALDVNELSTSLVWVALILYTMQIYYDFSGYSDMAIGLGKIFGFDFMENFNYPYISKSIQEFWRRWHISLSTWFKEYLYIPLGGSRKGHLSTYINIAIVFFATGLWHGASYNFVVWGLYYGFFLIFERVLFGSILSNNRFKLLNHFYVIIVVIIGWVFFRANDLLHAISLLKIMFLGQQSLTNDLGLFINNKVVFLSIVGIVFCGPLQYRVSKLKEILYSEEISLFWERIVQILLLFTSTMLLACNTFNPFIYFRF